MMKIHEVRIAPREYKLSSPILVGGKHLLMVLLDGKGRMLYDVTNDVQVGYVDTVKQMMELITAGYSGTVETYMSEGTIHTNQRSCSLTAIWFLSHAKKIHDEGITAIDLIETNYR